MWDIERICVQACDPCIREREVCYMTLMTEDTKVHRTTIEIDADALEEAREILGTSTYRQTVNEALRAVGRAERRRRGAAAISAGKLGLVSPDALARQRQPRTD